MTLRRTAILTGTATIVLAGMAFAVTAGQDYNGNIKGDPYPDSSIAFDVDRTPGGDRKVKRVVASGLDFTCEAGSPGETSAVTFDRGFRVDDDGRFGGHADATIEGFDPPASFRGEFRPHGKVLGKLRVHGELDPIGQPSVDCDTGLLEWKATKGPRETWRPARG